MIQRIILVDAVKGPYRRLSWLDVAPWIAAVALAFFLLGFHTGINANEKRHAATWSIVSPRE